MTKSRENVAEMVTKNLGRYSVGGGAEPTAYVTALEHIDLAHAELARHGIAWWGSNEIPDEAASALAQYVAGDVADQFVDEDRAVYLRSQIPLAMRRLSAVTMTPDLSGAPVRITDY
jgi:hypothetical protein